MEKFGSLNNIYIRISFEFFQGAQIHSIIFSKEEKSAQALVLSLRNMCKKT